MSSPSEKRAADQLAALLPEASPPSKQAKLNFKKMTQDEHDRKLQLEVIDHRADKEKAAVIQDSGVAQKEQIANSWGLQLPRPLPRTSKGGPKRKAKAKTNDICGVTSYNNENESSPRSWKLENEND